MHDLWAFLIFSISSVGVEEREGESQRSRGQRPGLWTDGLQVEGSSPSGAL